MSNGNGPPAGPVRANTRRSDWMARNLVMQGYCMTAHERERLRLGLRFATGLCLVLVAVGLGLESSTLFVTLSVIGAAAGFAPRHPFDLIWNYGARHAFGAVAIPPTPTRRRHAFKIGTLWLLGVAALLADGLSTAALALGGTLIAACALVTATNFCVPSFLLSLLDRPRHGSTSRDTHG
jgi:hypothetical protein